MDDPFIRRSAVVTVEIVVVAMVFTLLAGLFSPSVNNSDIFKIIGPVFTMIAGALVSILSRNPGGKD